MAVPYNTASTILKLLLDAIYPRNPPANESPAPVGSNTSISGIAGIIISLEL